MSANQSRRRNDPVPTPSPVTSSSRRKIDNALPYKGRHLDENSIRLVEIQPAAHQSDAVVCTLIEVTFASRPKFEALSYMWGTEKADDPITLNESMFEVTRNLLDALLFLRRQIASGKAHQTFWIDAICINQSDVDERNQQLQKMDQIYFRAGTVVVWLGNEYTKFQEGEKTEGNPEEGFSTQDDKSNQQTMVRHLRTDPYWNRLWILQEIGRARKLRVCFGNECLSWDPFMHLITMHNSDGNTGPLRLNRLLRQERYEDSHTLKRLLEEHREAECSEPRDKVYGLVGLASDAAEFPMDYTKSLYEVWKDTMVFMNRWDLFKDESQILPIGALVKSALMANSGDPLSQVSGEQKDQVDSTQLIDNPMSPLVFQLNAVVLGCVIHVGPSASDIISQPSEASKWRTATQRLFPANELGPAHREHDRLFHALLESNESEAETKCFNRPSTVVWEEVVPQNQFPTSVRDYIEKVRAKTNVAGTAAAQPAQTLEKATGRLASVQPRLYLTRRYGNPTLRKMGVASGLVRPEDFVCWIRSSRQALLVRVVEYLKWSPGVKLRVFGTALATEDMCGSTLDYDRRWRSVHGEWKMGVRVDADTIFMLLK